MTKIKELDVELNEEYFKKLYANLHSNAKNSDIYKKLTRRKYRPVNGYENWLDIMLEFTVALDGSARRIETLGLNPLMLLTIELINNYQVKHSPTYWLDKNLANTLKQCDIPEGITELPACIPHGLILFPTEYAPLDKQGDSINWILFSQMKAGEQFPAIIVGKQYAVSEPIKNDCILWVSQTKETALYSGGITSDFKYHSVNPTEIALLSDDKNLTEEISNLLLQSLLVAQWYPEYTEVAESGTGFSKQRTHRSIKKENSWLNPKWIGDLYKKRPKTPTPYQGGTHVSPITHTRRGHWRNQAYGSKWSEHRMILIEPTEVKCAE